MRPNAYQTHTAEDRQYVINQGKLYNGLEKDILDVISRDRATLRQEHFETTRNLAIISGAFAAFAIPLLKAGDLLLLSGIALLVLDSLFCFVHLWGVLYRNAENSRELKRRTLQPVHRASMNCLDFIRGKKTFDQWADAEACFVGQYDVLSAGLAGMSAKADHLDYSSEILLTIFGLANALIMGAMAARFMPA